MSATMINNGRYERNGHEQQKRFPRGIILGEDGAPINGMSLIDPQALMFSGSGTGYGNYGANVTKNSLAGWLWRGSDADGDIGLNVQILRERSRDAFMGIPLASGAVETFDTNVIGEGLYPAPNVDGEALGLSAAATADLNKELADKFEWWACDPRECDFESRDTFYLKQSTVFQSMLLSGDCPVLFPLTQRPNTLFDLRIRVLEADRIMNPPTIDPTKNIFSGVELDDEGELLAYHIAKRHPLALHTSRIFALPLLIGQTVRVEPFGAQTGRRNMVLLIKPERPEQRRGVPILAPCLELLKQNGRYIDATVVAAVIQSYFTAFITQEFPDPNMFQDLLTDEQKQQILDFSPYNVQLGPGVVNFMRPGHAVNFSAPTQPHSTFGEFTIACAKFVGAAIGMPYEVLLKQFNASYSASRAALLEFWKRVRKYRSIMVDGLCQPVYEEWVIDAVSLNRIERFKGDVTDIYVRRALTRCNWTGASAGSLDPQKEVAAAEAKVNAGFSTIERESMELNGSNWRDNVRQQSTEKTEFTEADLTFPPERQGAQLGAGGKLYPTPPPAQPAPAPAAPASAAPQPAAGAATSARHASRRSRRDNHALSTSGAIIR
jgi:lambda family phage portal protein